MKKKYKYTVGIFLTLIILALLVLWLKPIKSSPSPQNSQNTAAHLAGDPQTSISNISVEGFYFVPNDRTPEPETLWQNQLNMALGQTKSFYEFQTNQAVKIAFSIDDQPVIGVASSTYYDGNNTDEGNPHALLAVRSELLSRFYKAKAQANVLGGTNTYRVMAILYEGVGASAIWVSEQSNGNSLADVVPPPDNQPPALLVSRYYFTGPSYVDYDYTTFAHEFGHVLGLGDDFDLTSGQNQSDDIMGSGRFQPLSYEFLSTQNRQLLGLSY